jgi:hypothetical protein
VIVDAEGRAAEPDPPAEAPARALYDAWRASALPWIWDPDREGLDCRCGNEVTAGPNRGRLKVWSPRPRVVVAFVYKDSILPFSRDRFAYGAWTLKGAPPPSEQVHTLLDYVASGLHPEHRPTFLRRALPFTVPR